MYASKNTQTPLSIKLSNAFANFSEFCSKNKDIIASDFELSSISEEGNISGKPIGFENTINAKCTLILKDINADDAKKVNDIITNTSDIINLIEEMKSSFKDENQLTILTNFQKVLTEIKDNYKRPPEIDHKSIKP